MKENPRSYLDQSAEKLFYVEPKVKLLGVIRSVEEDLSAPELEAISSSLVIAGEAARTCYSSNLFPPKDYLRNSHRKVTEEVIRSTRESGHLTTRQHVHFIFGLEKVSRSAIWVLHGHPFYNSEQQSQRYVEVKAGNYLVPILPVEELTLYEQAAGREMGAYRQLVDILTPVAAKEYFRIFPARAKRAEAYAGEIQKKAQEVARYVLPIAAYTSLYHTVSALTLMRYARTCQFYDVPTETKMLVEKMVAEVNKADPGFQEELTDPISLEKTPEFQALTSLRGEVDFEAAREFVEEFDWNLDNKISKLELPPPGTPETLAKAVRAVLGISQKRLSDKEAIAMALDPAKNSLLGDVLNVMTMSKLCNAMQTVNYTFAKRISHTADSQDQRHRMTPAARPVLAAHYTGKPDYITPALIKESPEAQLMYAEVMDKTFEAINQLLERGVSWEKASYLLPNAFPIRFYESGTLLNLHHKYRMRLCFTAQEEIWRASIEEAEQIENVHPEIGKHFFPSCNLRKEAKATPYCPEGKRFCGVTVWQQKRDRYQRVI